MKTSAKKVSKTSVKKRLSKTPKPKELKSSKPKKVVQVLTIDRRKWLTGRALGRMDSLTDSSLLDAPTGMMCCLGFLARACGVPPTALSGHTKPSNLSRDNKRKMPAWLFGKTPTSETTTSTSKERPFDSDISSVLMELNDAYFSQNREREKRIAEIFKEQGIVVKFKGRYPLGLRDNKEEPWT